jgi:crotonobetainyl-CoA:carnitine CoA-transferase CaiB-like acyl-CoA transferase
MSSLLDGAKVLDLSMNLPGPYMTWVLASMGADVLKVENPQGGDYARTLGVGTAGGSNPLFTSVNRNKRSMCLNLKHPKGKEILLRLLKDYDILVEGFRPGTMERLGVGYDVTSQKQPRLIHAAISGYGQTGPNRSRAGHDLNYLALAGIIGMTGSRSGEPAIPGVQIADLAGGSLWALVTLLAAMLERERTGKGRYIDVSMFHGALSLATMVHSGIEAGLEEPRPGAMMLTGRFPCYGVYGTKDGRYMALGALEPKFWANFCAAVGRQDLAGGQFGGPDVVDRVAGVFAEKTLGEWTEIFAANDACCEPVLTLKEAVSSPLVTERGMIRTTENGMRQLNPPVTRHDDKDSGSGLPAPDLGEHTGDVLGSIGLTEEDIASLKRDGVI